MLIPLKADPKRSNQGASGVIALIINEASSEELEVRNRLAGCRLGALYRVNVAIRNREFLIWAKGKGGVSPSRAAIFKKCKAG